MYTDLLLLWQLCHNYVIYIIIVSFSQMENIGNFLEGCYAYGVPKTDLFQTVDLYEKQNMPLVGVFGSMFSVMVVWLF